MNAEYFEDLAAELAHEFPRPAPVTAAELAEIVSSIRQTLEDAPYSSEATTQDIRDAEDGWHALRMYTALWRDAADRDGVRYVEAVLGARAGRAWAVDWDAVELAGADEEERRVGIPEGWSTR